MRVLVVGGTRFVGKHLVDACVTRGHDVTLFNRGTTRPGLFPDLERIVGNRDEDLTPLSGRSWDVVIDTCAYEAPQVKRLLETIGPDPGFYVLISTISVYAPPGAPGITEDAPRLSPVVNGALAYGANKAQCEDTACAMLPAEKLLIVRPGLVVGPEDHTGRFPYWVDRMAGSDPFIVPAPASNPLQVIDARDLAGFIVRCSEAGHGGTVHATGPATSITVGGAMSAMHAVAKTSAATVWVDPVWLQTQGVVDALPLMMGRGDPIDLLRVNIGRALALGLALRPFASTFADTMEWLIATPDAIPSGIGLSRSRERELLRTWSAKESQ